MRKVQRREKNRIAAQKSRLRQTQKADTLHLVSTPTLPISGAEGSHKGQHAFTLGTQSRGAQLGQDRKSEDRAGDRSQRLQREHTAQDDCH